MDFEKEMQKSLKVIFENIQALDEKREKTPTNLIDREMCGKRQQRKLSVPVQGSSSKSVGKSAKLTPRKNRGLTI